MTKASEYMRSYYARFPWRKNLKNSKRRAKLKGWVNTLTNEQIKFLWERDKAHLLESPSIDRIDPSKGYFLENCRFIERKENCSLGSLGRKTTEKQREASRVNLGNWARNNPPWNKGNKPAKKNCKNCGKLFQPKRSVRVMCSAKCTAIYARSKQA